MSTDWNEWGVRLPITILQVHICSLKHFITNHLHHRLITSSSSLIPYHHQIQNCYVTERFTKEKNGFTALQVCGGYANLKQTKKALKGKFAKADVPPAKRFVQFPVTPDALLPLGKHVF
jgi:hypothetical protein